MRELFDTSRLPDDEAHWDAVADRIATNIVRDARGMRWFIQSPASWVAASVALAASLILLVQPTDRGGLLNDYSAALAPTDEVARAMMLSEAPPAIDALLLGRPETRIR